ncbi:cell envelope opacity-associated protein A [Erwinia sp. CPCC 100877]|nr:cell envelope opacity-associated protein A [Erwinia sp. CPCC 100877]
MPKRIINNPILARIWHAPDQVRLMAPLPSMHRRGIILGALLIVIGILLPGSESMPEADSESHLHTNKEAPAPEPSVVNNRGATPSQLSKPMASAGAQEREEAQAPIPYQNNDIEQQWRSYRVESGKTLAQLFRDQGLPPADVYAMAKVEGQGEPLSSLQQGQVVKIRQNASGVVTGLAVEGGEQQVLFTRQPNGSFLRVR